MITIEQSTGKQARIFHEITGTPSANPSAPPLPVANPAQTARPGRQYSLYCAPCLRGPTEGRPPLNPLQTKGSVKGFGRAAQAFHE